MDSVSGSRSRRQLNRREYSNRLSSSRGPRRPCSRTENSGVASDSAHRQCGRHSSCATEFVTHSANCTENMNIPQLRCIDEVIGNPFVQVPRIQVVEKTVETPQTQTHS